jgi:hypothetical protein
MQKFLELEGAYLVIAAFIMVVTVFVTTRPFMGKSAFKIGVPLVFVILATLIFAHFYVVTSRMSEVKTTFLDNKSVICENRTQRKVAQSIIISKELGWSLQGDNFSNPEYNRTFHTARCLPYD